MIAHAYVAEHDLFEAPETTVRRYVHAAMDLLEREGLAVDVEHRMEDWAGTVRAGARNAGANPTFDPDATGPFEPDHAFWLRVRRGDHVLAVAASRLIDCGWYYHHVRAGLLWSRAPGRPVPILIDEPGFRGPLAHSGGFWVRPDARGTGLSWIIPRLNQAISQLVWPIEDVCSVIFAGVHDAGLPAAYGSHRCRLLVDGEFWPTGRRERIYSAEYPGHHMVARAQRDLDLMHAHPDQQMRDLAAVARQRNGQAAV